MNLSIIFLSLLLIQSIDGTFINGWPPYPAFAKSIDAQRFYNCSKNYILRQKSEFVKNAEAVLANYKPPQVKKYTPYQSSENTKGPRPNAFSNLFEVFQKLLPKELLENDNSTMKSILQSYKKNNESKIAFNTLIQLQLKEPSIFNLLMAPQSMLVHNLRNVVKYAGGPMEKQFGNQSKIIQKIVMNSVTEKKDVSSTTTRPEKLPTPSELIRDDVNLVSMEIDDNNTTNEIFVDVSFPNITIEENVENPSKINSTVSIFLKETIPEINSKGNDTVISESILKFTASNNPVENIENKMDILISSTGDIIEIQEEVKIEPEPTQENSDEDVYLISTTESRIADESSTVEDLPTTTLTDGLNEFSQTSIDSTTNTNIDDTTKFQNVYTESPIQPTEEEPIPQELSTTPAYTDYSTTQETSEQSTTQAISAEETTNFNIIYGETDTTISEEDDSPATEPVTSQNPTDNSIIQETTESETTQENIDQSTTSNPNDDITTEIPIEATHKENIIFLKTLNQSTEITAINDSKIVDLLNNNIYLKDNLTPREAYRKIDIERAFIDLGESDVPQLKDYEISPLLNTNQANESVQEDSQKVIYYSDVMPDLT